MNIIKKELGITKEDKDDVVDRMKERLKGLTLPEPVMKVVEYELGRLQSLESASAEFGYH
jgi:ATP-dependent Lon protease